MQTELILFTDVLIQHAFKTLFQSQITEDKEAMLPLVERPYFPFPTLYCSLRPIYL